MIYMEFFFFLAVAEKPTSRDNSEGSEGGNAGEGPSLEEGENRTSKASKVSKISKISRPSKSSVKHLCWEEVKKKIPPLKMTCRVSTSYESPH